MKGSRAASRYAKSLLELAIDENKLEAVHADMLVIHNAVEDNRDLEMLLKSPVVKTDKKQAILDGLFGKKVGEITNKFLNIITTKRREGLLGMIAEEFLNHYRAHMNIAKAEVVSAIALDDNLRSKVMKVLESAGVGQIELVEKVDPTIVGGLIVKLGDRQVDASVARKFRDLKQSFSENPYVADF